MKFQQRKIYAAVAAGMLVSFGANISAQELRVQCYSDGNECDVTGEIAKKFEAANAGIKIVIDKVPYKAVVEQLPVSCVYETGRLHTTARLLEESDNSPLYDGRQRQRTPVSSCGL